MSPSILIVEDEAVIALALKIQLMDLGLDVVGTVTNGPAAVEAFERHQPNVVLMDIQLRGGMDGCELSKLLTSRFGAKIVYVTGQGDTATRNRAMQTRPAGYLVKPFAPDQLGRAIGAALAADHCDDEGTGGKHC